MTSKTHHYESHIQSLFSFALGVISGAEGARLLANGQPLDALEDLPQAYVFAGGSPDEKAGDALLKAKHQWFVVEMKRGPIDFKAELTKPRVLELRGRLAKWRTGADPASQALWRTSYTAHVFVYGGRRTKGGLAIQTRSYSEWLQNNGQSGCVDLVQFLARAGQKGVPGSPPRPGR